MPLKKTVYISGETNPDQIYLSAHYLSFNLITTIVCQQLQNSSRPQAPFSIVQSTPIMQVTNLIANQYLAFVLNSPADVSYIRHNIKPLLHSVLSSTEAEFIAACEAGKYILYVRTILEEIGMPQEAASILYEDNQGALLMANARNDPLSALDMSMFATSSSKIGL